VVQDLLVQVVQFVEDDEDPLGGVLHDRGQAPSQLMSSPPKVSRQPSSQPLPRIGECGQRSAISEGSILVAYAAYSSTAHQRNEAACRCGGSPVTGSAPGGRRPQHPGGRRPQHPGGREE